MLALPLGDMSDVDHVHCFDLGGKFLLSPYVRPPDADDLSHII